MLEAQGQTGSRYAGQAAEHRLHRLGLNSSLSVDLFLIAFVLIYSLVGMRNFDLHMADLHEDDGPILYARAFRDPTLFEGDFQVGAPLSLRTYFMMITSVMVGIPAILWRYLNIDPYAITWLITLTPSGNSTQAMVKGGLNLCAGICTVVYEYNFAPSLRCVSSISSLEHSVQTVLLGKNTLPQDLHLLASNAAPSVSTNRPSSNGVRSSSISSTIFASFGKHRL